VGTTPNLERNFNLQRSFFDADTATAVLGVFASSGDTESVIALLAGGANVHGPQRDDVALRAAAKNGHLQTVRALIKAGANVHARKGEALHLALRNGHIQVANEIAKAMLSDSKNPAARGTARQPPHPCL
jgi:ankyrin repeat protein